MKKLFFLLLVFASINTYAQDGDLHFDHLNVVEGLPESTITSLRQDKLGYIWAGTQNGLVRYDGYKVKVYKLGLGIKGNFFDFAVDGMYETGDGELWFASRSNGVFRYNRAGDDFEQYKIYYRSNGFAYKNLVIDNDGYLWVGPSQAIKSGAPVSFPAARLNIKTRRQDKFPYAVTSIVNSKTGKVWLGTDQGLVYYDRATGKMSKAFFPLTAKGRQFILNLYEAPSEPGVLWFDVVDEHSRSIGLYSFNTRTGQYKKYTPDPHSPGAIASADINIIHEDNQRRLWFGTSAGLSLFNPINGNFKNYTPPAPLTNTRENPITVIAEQAGGKLWLGGFSPPRNGNGLQLFDPSDGSFKRYIHDERKSWSLNVNLISTLLVDRTGSLWVGMGWGGLDRVNGLRSQFDIYLPGTSDKNGYPAGGAIGVAMAADDYCWMGSKEGLIRWRPGTGLFERIGLPPYIKKDNVEVLAADRDGLIWCSSADVSLFAYDPKAAKTDTLNYPGKWRSALPTAVVYQDHTGVIWIGTNGVGLYRYDKLIKKFTTWPYETAINGSLYTGKKLDNGQVRSIYEDRQGVLWVGTNLGGLNRFNKKDGTFTSFYDLKKGLTCVTHIDEDKAGHFWLGTYLSGLFLFDRKTVGSKQFMEKGGLLDDDIGGLEEDADGNFWIPCQRGFTRFDPANNTYAHYTSKNALPFAFGKMYRNSFVKTSDDRLIVFARDGAVSFYPGQMHKSASPPQVLIETIAHNDPQSKDAQVMTDDLYGKQRVELPHNQNRISFDYVALHYQNPAQNQYAYQLMGYDKNWVQAGTQRSVTYTNLSPGTYTFKVKASNSDGVWNEKGTSIMIVIRSPWWFTWWAWMLWIVLFISAVYALIAYRSHKLLHDKLILEEIVDARTTEVMEQKEEIIQQKEEIEAQAAEALKQASIDRVRGEIASMRSTDDLQRITPLIWNELTVLGVPFTRCGVFIVDEEGAEIRSYLSTPDGKALASYPIAFSREGFGHDLLVNWRKHQAYTDHWGEEQFKDYSKNLVEQGVVESQEKYMGALPAAGLDLHFVPFLQGMLYVGNVAPLNENEMHTVQLLAESFSGAYARYEDFNKLEAAKKQVDNTLIDLKAAQSQLIQTEKMASLGELTAGIAHEIQNPLNFVNNFSEINAELLGEMKHEIGKGDLEEIKAIAADIEENSKKINMHGKRADSIVKGMLEHARKSTGVKQAIDINALADEYLRLSYHGLRAKDKSFNALLTENLDSTLPKAEVIGQDIGRVLLNLYNNAFYAVYEKQKKSGADYKPEVTISTSARNGHVLVRVKDNGNGIPDKVRDKIMQPFFTTKPTGEGTGLGLSLSYDIVVKVHGGSIDLDTKEGEYTEFTITLPL